jgi:hypothetical protein
MTSLQARFQRYLDEYQYAIQLDVRLDERSAHPYQSPMKAGNQEL